MKNKLALIFVLAITVLILSFNFQNILLSFENFYYHQINPRAGVRNLELLYKQNFDGAEKARDEANFLIAELPQKAKTINEVFAYQEKIREIFSQREAFYTEMVRLDDKGKSLNLSKDYLEFFQKRKLADENDYDAFKIYREGMQGMMDGTLAYIKFAEIYSQAISSIYALKESNFKDTNFLEGYSYNLNSQFSEIESLSKKGIFTKELTDALNFKNKNIGLLRDFSKSISLGNDKKAKEIKAVLEERSKKEPNEAELVTNWIKEKRGPLFVAQDEKHKKSLDLYNQAYIFAKNQNLDVILNVWGGNSPGIVNEKKEAI